MKKSRVLIAMLLWAVISAGAHPLDQYLELAQLDLTPKSIAIEIRLIPGALISERVIEAIDLNGDGLISEEEQSHYLGLVVSDIDLRVDGRKLEIRTISSSFSSKSEIADGSGTIVLQLSADIDLSDPGGHEVEFSNKHLPGLIVSQVNVLTPKSPSLYISEQSRNADQRKFSFTVSDGRLSLISKIELGALALLFILLMVFYIRRTYR